MVGNKMTLEDLQPGVSISGIVANSTVTVIVAQPMGGDGDGNAAVNLVYSTSDGNIGQEIVDTQALENVHIVTAQDSGPEFDADPEDFRLAAEALRIKYAALYDPMAAVYASDIDPLPHQIRAVYEDMLPKVPLRFLLADDPGAGKTIMAGLYIKEMLLRSAAERVVIVCPGGLAEQWRDELQSKFGLDFTVFESDMLQTSWSGNPFQDNQRLIVRMDQVARNETLMDMMAEVSWDIAIVDEAHRMSAHFKNSNGDISKTGRFKLGEILSRTSENYLLMTATPHSGNEKDFQLFMTLLDADRFAGSYRKGDHRKTDTAGLMRRMVKEKLLTFDGKHLFPERHAETVSYTLSAGESDLYRSVTEYVRSGMNAASSLSQSDSRRGSNVGFALTILQRRLASSPEAILRSLERRRDKLGDILARIQRDPDAMNELLHNDAEEYGDERINEDVYDDMWDDVDENRQGQLELHIDQMVGSATAARTKEELSSEIFTLDNLVEQARTVRSSEVDAKWSQLSSILQERVLDSGTSQLSHKMIVFTEHRDTLDYVAQRIRTLLGKEESVVVIHGGMSRNQRKAMQEQFVNNPQTRILVATDAAGEGLNLQRADLMVNYDLPWNPNRIEQRFGRIHRIGQQRVCFLWNMVAANTREGDVYRRLLEKISTIDKAYSGNLFNVLGETKAFENQSLKDLMVTAIQYGDDPNVQAQLDRTIDASVRQGLDELVNERSAHPEMYPSLDVQHVRELMERTRARKLQPGYIAQFFLRACKRLGCSVHPRESGRWELTRIPHSIIAEAEHIDRRKPVAGAYERITFEPKLVHIGVNKPDAVLVTPGNALLTAVTELVLDRFGDALRKGTIFVDRTHDAADNPTLFMAAEQSIANGQNDLVSRHFDYFQIDGDRVPSSCPTPAYLDYDRPKNSESMAISDICGEQWVREDHSQIMREYIYAHGTQPRLQELQTSHTKENEHVRSQVRERLHKEIEYWSTQYNIRHDKELGGQMRKGKSASSAMKRVHEYEQRLQLREKELDADTRLHAKPAVIRGVALVIPERCLIHTSSADSSRLFARQTKEVDERAVALTMNAERAVGRKPVEMPHNNKGYDIQSTDAEGRKFFIEVKGRIDLPEAKTFTVTTNEATFAKTQGDRHRLSLVRVSPQGAQYDRIRYVRHAFDHMVESVSTISANEDWAVYWKRGVDPC